MVKFASNGQLNRAFFGRPVKFASCKKSLRKQTAICCSMDVALQPRKGRPRKQKPICCSFRGVPQVHCRWALRFPSSQRRADWATRRGVLKLQQIGVCFGATFAMQQIAVCLTRDRAPPIGGEFDRGGVRKLPGRPLEANMTSLVFHSQPFTK